MWYDLVKCKKLFHKKNPALRQDFIQFWDEFTFQKPLC